MHAKLNKKQTDLVVSILNCLIEKLPQDEYNFDDHYVGWYEDEGKLVIEQVSGDDLTDTLEWVLTEVIDMVCKGE